MFQIMFHMKTTFLLNKPIKTFKIYSQKNFSENRRIEKEEVNHFQETLQNIMNCKEIRPIFLIQKL
jgi:hypothetical protein